MEASCGGAPAVEAGAMLAPHGATLATPVATDSAACADARAAYGWRSTGSSAVLRGRRRTELTGHSPRALPSHASVEPPLRSAAKPVRAGLPNSHTP